MGLQAASRHNIDLVTLPARFWKWRMDGAALKFFTKVKHLDSYDGLLVTDMMRLSDFAALAGPEMPPALVYFHENQFSYPLSPGETMDYHYGLGNLTTALSAEKVVFNSDFQLQLFLEKLAQFIKIMPDYRPGWVKEVIRKKSGVIYPGCRFPAGHQDLTLTQLDPPLVVWNHRWEHDKNPAAFFNALETIKKKGIRFHLALLGERYSKVPDVFNDAQQQFSEEIQVCGYVESRQDYMSWLKKGAVVVSTAFQENFGISVVEAVRMGCVPLLPDRLSYPEIMPGAYHPEVLYDNQADLVMKLGHLLTDFKGYASLQSRLSKAMEKYSWEIVVKKFDTAFESMADGRSLTFSPGS